MIIIKRDGRQENFNAAKIINTIKKAAKDANYEISPNQMANVINEIITKINTEKIEIEKLQNIIESALYVSGLRKVRDSYNSYRKERTSIRDFKSDLMRVIDTIGINTDKDNANVGNNFSAKLLRIASESNKWHNLAVMPKHLAKAHEYGDLYYHDLDSLNLTINCLHIPTAKMLAQGFNTGYGTIRPPKRIESAAELSCILLQASQNDMFGGQSHPNFDNDMAPYVESTRQEIRKEIDNDDEVENKVEKAVSQAMQSIVYNLNSMASRAGQ